MTTPSPEGKALRFNEGKPELGRLLEFGSALDKLVKVMEQGAVKYADGNWLLGGKPDREYIDSALRHMQAFSSGEDFDPDIGTHHLAHAAWNLLALLRLNLDFEPSLDPEFDQAGFVKRYTEIEEDSSEVAIGMVDDSGEIEVTKEQHTDDTLKALLMDHYPGWLVGDRFWHPMELGDCGWRITEVNEDGSALCARFDRDGRKLTSDRLMAAEAFDEFTVERAS